MNNHSNPDFDMPTPVLNIPELDLAEYTPYVEDYDMTEEQKREFLETLWSIMAHFVSLGFDVGNVDICGQLCPEFNAASGDGPDDVEFTPSTVTETQSNSIGKDGNP